MKFVTQAMFYEKEEIDQELKCPRCNERYQSPRILPCGDSICFGCVELIKDQNSNDLYKCPVCEEDHTINSQSLPRNKILEKLLTKQANEVYRNKNVEQLKEKLEKLNSKIEKLDYRLKYPNQTVIEYCKCLFDQIDLATEKAHQLINEFHDSLFNRVKEYEIKSLGYYNGLKESGDEFLEKDLESAESAILEADQFLKQKLEYLKKFMIDDEEINRSIIDSDQHISKIKEFLASLNMYLFRMGKMKFVEKVKDTKVELLGKLRITNKQIILRSQSLSIQNLLTGHHIFNVHSLNDAHFLIISSYNDYIQLNKLNQNGTVEANKNVLCLNGYAINLHVIVKSIFDEEKITLLIKFVNEEKHYDYKIIQFDTNLHQIKEKIVSKINNVVSIGTNDSKYYCLLTSTSKKNFLSIYDADLNEIAQKGLEAKQETDPFYFSTKAIQLKVSKQSIYILETGLMKEMNEETGLVTREFPLEGSSFEIIKNGFAIFNGSNTITTYHKSGKKEKDIVLADKFDQCDLKYFSDFNLIGINSKTNKIIVSSK